MDDSKKTEDTQAEQDETLGIDQQEPEPKKHPMENLAGLMSIYASLIGNHISKSEDLSASDKLALLRSAHFVMGQAHAMAAARASRDPEAKGVPYLPWPVDMCMATADLLSRTMLGETQAEPVLETADTAAGTLAPKPADEPLIVVPGREDNRHARRTAKAKQ